MARNPWRRDRTPKVGSVFFHSRLRLEIPESPVRDWPKMSCRVEDVSPTHVTYRSFGGEVYKVALNQFARDIDSWTKTAAFPEDLDTDDDGSADDGDGDGAPFEGGGDPAPPGAPGGDEQADPGPAPSADPSVPPQGDQAVEETQSDKLVFRCPFCGSQGIVGRSDGSIDCSACETRFMVEVMPQFPHAPLVNDDGTPFDAQTADGYPDESPGVASAPTTEPDPVDPAMGGEPTRRPAFLDDDHPSTYNAVDDDGGDGEDDFGFGEDADDDTDDDGVDDDSDTDDDDDGVSDEADEDDDGDDADDTPDFLKDPDTKKKPKKSSRFTTKTGARLDEDAYMRHLAWQHGGSPRVG